MFRYQAVLGGYIGINIVSHSLIQTVTYVSNWVNRAVYFFVAVAASDALKGSISYTTMSPQKNRKYLTFSSLLYERQELPRDLLVGWSKRW